MVSTWVQEFKESPFSWVAFRFQWRIQRDPGGLLLTNKREFLGPGNMENE